MKIRPTPNRKTFWVTNLSNRSISIHDLGITLKPMSVADLLDPKRYRLTEEQVNKSYTSGSLFQKGAFVKKRENEPVIDDDEKKLLGVQFATDKTNAAIMRSNMKVDPNALVPSRQRSILEIKLEEHEELKLSDDQEQALKEEFDAAAETADTVAYDRQPLIPKK